MIGRGEPGEWRRGGATLAAATIGMGAGYNLFVMAASQFLIPMQAEWHLPRTALLLGPLVGMMSALLSPVAGALADRCGARPLALVGMPLLALLYLLMAVLPVRIAGVYVIAVLIGLASGFGSPTIFCRAVGTWFTRNSGLAISITMSGMSTVAMVAIPALAWLIAHHGWRAGYIGLAGLSLLVGTPAILMGFRENEAGPARRDGREGDPPGRVRRAAMRDPRFWRLGVAFTLAGLFIGGVIGHLQAILVEQGFSPLRAAAIGSIHVAAIGVGRLAVGVLLDRLNPDAIAGLCLGAAACGLPLLGLGGGTSLLVAGVAAALIGLGQGAEADFLAFFTMKAFGMEAFGTIFGLFALLVGLGIALGGLLFGLLRDVLGNYDLACDLASGAMFAAAILMLRTTSGSASSAPDPRLDGPRQAA